MNTQGLNAPQFPGLQTGKLKSVEQVRDLIKKQRRLKGYTFNVPNGQSQQNLQLSGTARVLLGIQLIPIAPGTDTFIQGFQNISEVSFKVNNEIIIESLSPQFLTNYSNDEEYCDIPRPLSGTDQITISFTNSGATEKCAIAVYYI
jgi:hypothetical protein|tara:strand:- start:2352 stop:2789 length:438 start_codon:yes stop_codon:yes gene_type:complete